MARFIVRRLLIAIPVLVLVSLMSFAVIWLVPGDPAAVFLDASATPEQLAQVRHRLGLDEPFYLQMIAWYGRILHGDLGQSILLNRRRCRGHHRAAAGDAVADRPGVGVRDG